MAIRISINWSKMKSNSIEEMKDKQQRQCTIPRQVISIHMATKPQGSKDRSKQDRTTEVRIIKVKLVRKLIEIKQQFHNQLIQL